jgi:hypothetical protein
VIEAINVHVAIVKSGEAVEHLRGDFDIAQTCLVLARAVLERVAKELVFLGDIVRDVFDVVRITRFCGIFPNTFVATMPISTLLIETV